MIFVQNFNALGDSPWRLSFAMLHSEGRYQNQQGRSQWGNRPIFRGWPWTKSKDILPKPDLTNEDGKRQIWSSNWKYLGFEKGNVHNRLQPGPVLLIRSRCLNPAERDSTPREAIEALPGEYIHYPLIASRLESWWSRVEVYHSWKGFPEVYLRENLTRSDLDNIYLVQRGWP